MPDLQLLLNVGLVGAFVYFTLKALTWFIKVGEGRNYTESDPRKIFKIYAVLAFMTWTGVFLNNYINDKKPVDFNVKIIDNRGNTPGVIIEPAPRTETLPGFRPMGSN